MYNFATEIILKHISLDLQSNICKLNSVYFKLKALNSK